MKKLFKESYPKIFEELHPTKNPGIDFSLLYENSGRKVWWRCRSNSKHVWYQSITRRTKSGYGCPYCSGRFTLPEDSFAFLYPEIAAELHPTKNNSFDPYAVRPQCNKKVWWKCSKGHEWQQAVGHRIRGGGGCRECKKIMNSFYSKYPELAKEWHNEKNGSLKPTDIYKSSRIKVWWRCLKEPSHEWTMTIEARIRNRSGCPKCKEVSKGRGRLPALNVYDPVLSGQWHPTKNGNLSPASVTPGIRKKVWWRCPKNKDHEWKASISNRVKGRGCPYCAKIKATPENLLQIRFPKIAAQWHPTKNKTLSLSEISYGSARKVWWQCQKEKKHVWQETVVERTARNKVACPFCSKSRYYETNSLSACHPEIAQQWHPTKNNNLNPGDVTRASGKVVWWQCPDNSSHEWKARIKNRTVLGSGCPYCSEEKNIIRLSAHLFDLTIPEINYYHVFLGNINTIKKLIRIDLKGKRRLEQPLHRMIYSSIITSLETYLSDAFCSKIAKNSDLQVKFIENNPEFEKRQYSLSEIIDWNKTNS